MEESVKIVIETHYCSGSDITFITEERIEGNKHWMKVVGFYFGSPDYAVTMDNLFDVSPCSWEGEKDNETSRD